MKHCLSKWKSYKHSIANILHKHLEFGTISGLFSLTPLSSFGKQLRKLPFNFTVKYSPTVLTNHKEQLTEMKRKEHTKRADLRFLRVFIVHSWFSLWVNTYTGLEVSLQGLASNTEQKGNQQL